MKFIFALRARLRAAHADHWAIARSMAWIVLFVLLAALARAAREMAIAYRYGVGAEVDAYLFVFGLVTWPIGIWLSVLTVVLVPLSVRDRHDVSNRGSGFRAEVLGLTLLLGLGLALLAWIGLPLLLRSSWTGLPEHSLMLALDMVPTLALLAPLGVVISLLSVWMLAAGRHVNTLLEGVPSLGLLLVLLAFPGTSVEPLVWGTLAGYLCHLISLLFPLGSRAEVGRPRLTRRAQDWPVFWQGFGIMLVGQALMSLTTIIDQFFAAHIGVGAIATLSYANRILTLAMAIGATAVSRATLPVFARVQVERAGQLGALAGHWVQLLFGFGLVAMLIAWWLAPWVTRIFFERGAFTAADSETVAQVLRYGLPQMPFYFASLVLVSLLVSQRNYQVIAVVSGLNLAVKTIANVILVPLLGVGGLMVSTSIMLGASCLFLIAAVKKRY